MTREELKQADTKKLISALQYCGRDSYYATYYDEVVDEITQRLNRIEELDKENGKLEGKLADLQSEYIEFENFHNNRVKGLKDILERVESENVRLIGKLAFTENTLNNRTAQIEEFKQLLQDIVISSGSDREELLKEAEQFLKEERK